MSNLRTILAAVFTFLAILILPFLVFQAIKYIRRKKRSLQAQATHTTARDNPSIIVTPSFKQTNLSLISSQTRDIAQMSNPQSPHQRVGGGLCPIDGQSSVNILSPFQQDKLPYSPEELPVSERRDLMDSFGTPINSINSPGAECQSPVEAELEEKIDLKVDDGSEHSNEVHRDEDDDLPHSWEENDYRVEEVDQQKKWTILEVSEAQESESSKPDHMEPWRRRDVVKVHIEYVLGNETGEDNRTQIDQEGAKESALTLRIDGDTHSECETSRRETRDGEKSKEKRTGGDSRGEDSKGFLRVTTFGNMSDLHMSKTSMDLVSRDHDEKRSFSESVDNLVKV